MQLLFFITSKLQNKSFKARKTLVYNFWRLRAVSKESNEKKKDVKNGTLSRFSP